MRARAKWNYPLIVGIILVIICWILFELKIYENQATISGLVGLILIGFAIIRFLWRLPKRIMALFKNCSNSHEPRCRKGTLLVNPEESVFCSETKGNRDATWYCTKKIWTVIIGYDKTIQNRYERRQSINKDI